MKLKKYHLVAILEECQSRGMTKIDEILEILKQFKDNDIVFQTIEEQEIK